MRTRNTLLLLKEGATPSVSALSVSLRNYNSIQMEWGLIAPIPSNRINASRYDLIQIDTVDTDGILCMLKNYLEM